PDGFRGREIDEQLKLGRLHHREVGWLRAFENPTRVDADLAVHGHGVGPVAHQSPGDDEWPPLVDRRNGMACRKRCELLATVDEEGISLHDKRTDRLLDKGIEG